MVTGSLETTNVLLGIMAGVSVALFSAYFISGVGAGGDAPADASLPIEPTGDGFAVRF